MERDKYLECEGNAIEKGRECAQGIVREEMEGKENKEGNKMMIEKEGEDTKKKDEECVGNVVLNVAAAAAAETRWADGLHYTCQQQQLVNM
ncbi:hypothetical protein Pmani_038749 [Petrolisthes manimaculis]|uniref:Uncharacterized protein n=1 Tax=Petrolisthes manimaculis TaxID=1843537 RepID=A0AAE1NGB2_9EUCA|nr:hypothetical protein Pmani_038749 [Petrolisthes manimaculis]